MNILAEFINLLQSLIDHLDQDKTEIPFDNSAKLVTDLKKELAKAIDANIQKIEEFKYEYFSGEILHSKSLNGEMYEYIGMRNAEIRKIQNQIDELKFPEMDSKNAKMQTKFEKLRSQAKTTLPGIGFALMNEDKFICCFIMWSWRCFVYPSSF